MKRGIENKKKRLFETFTMNNLIESDLKSIKSIKSINYNKENNSNLKFIYENDSNDDNDYICAICKQGQNIMSSDILDTLICCDGTCFQAFHLKCLNLKTIPKQEKWFCNDCKNKKHRCGICDKYGIDTEDKNLISDEYVRKCNRNKCGKYFHYNCLNPLITNKKHYFTCPKHECCICHQKKSPYLYTCPYCLNSYHANCIPPNAKYSEICVICPKHAEVYSLPKLYTENEVYGFLSDRGITLNLPDPKALPELYKSFFLPFSIYHDVKNNIPEYDHIMSNKWIKEHNRIPNNISKCFCSGSCGEKCINRCTDVFCTQVFLFIFRNLIIVMLEKDVVIDIYQV